MQLLIRAPQKMRMKIMHRAGHLPPKIVLIRLFSILFLCELRLLSHAAASVPEEGQALLDIKRDLKDSNNELYSWDGTSDQDHCYWRGVVCDNVTFNVIELSLSGLNLSGDISPSIGQLKKLQILNMSHNAISGQIPDEIGGCSSLDTIDLSFNQIKGDIPFSLSKLKELETFIMKSNQLSGPLPSTLSQLPNLKTLDLAENYLTGEIPSLIYWSEVLQYLGLRNNFISGTLSDDIWRMTALWYFDVRNNNITGEIPESIANCTSFQILDLSFNELTGSIPYSIGFLQVATLSLQGNRLTGKIPDVVGLMQALAVLDLSYNELEGPIPAILGNLSFTGKLYLQGNQLSGSIPHELGNMTKLQYLQVNKNQLSGRIPPELGKLDELFELNLANNYFEGSIPIELSYCVSLTYFNAHGNQLTGTIPPEFQNIVSLTDLNLSSNHIHGSIPPELGHFRNLDTLDLSDNLLTGSIPNSLGDLEHLITLDLSKNRLSGPIPIEFGNLRYIEKIDMSFNNLSGTIPQELGQLQNLDILYLNNNNFTGEIPEELSNCLSLAALNLSYNHLSGEIPEIRNFTRFAAESYIANKGLCGKQVGLICGRSAEPSRGLQSRNLFIGLGVTGTLFVVVLLAWLWKYNVKSGASGMKNSRKTVQGSPRIVMLHMDLAGHTFDDIMRLTDNLGERYTIGFGASSTVYKCTLKSGKPVAVKKLYTQCQQNVREFEVELATVGRIKHRNLVSLLGYSLSPQGNLLFYDYMENGSLWDVLHGERKMKLDWDLRLNIAIGAARGLAYLHHDCNPRIVHRDIKTSNILLDESYEAHLTDFGIAKNISLAKAHTSTLVMGTIGYIDPEYARTSRINEKSDVYSFGIVLLELLTGKKAVDNETNLHQWVTTKRENGALMEAVDPVLKDTDSDLAAVNKALQLGLLCTSKQPSARPTMNDVVRVLASLFPVTSLTKQPSFTPSLDFDYPRYLDEYGNSKSKDNLPESSNTSTGHLFVQFEEVISSNTVISSNRV